MSATEAVLLDLLGDGERFGLELVGQSDGRVKRGSVYVTLARMEAKGFVESRQEERAAGAIGLPRRLYKATELRRHRAAGLSVAAAGHQPAAVGGTVMGGRAMRAPALRGRWLAAAGRHVFSPESFARLVEPALADLQHRRQRPSRRRMDAYRDGLDRHGRRRATTASRSGARVFVRDNELVTLTGLVLLHTAHSAWMVVLLLGLDGRVHLKNVIASVFGALPGAGDPGRCRASWRCICGARGVARSARPGGGAPLDHRSGSSE